ncbi:cytochrome P450 [Mycena polygramma]|nr:cytochrome P450 [Mycena polygramma]
MAVTSSLGGRLTLRLYLKHGALSQPPPPTNMPSLLAFGLLFLVAAVLLRRVGSRERGLPPGPPTVPILGNIHIFPTEYPHYKLTEWARTYGGMYSLKLASATAIVVTDAAAVRELMDRRSGSTADRPPMHRAERTTGGLHLAFMRYNKNWTTLRRAAHTILNPQASTRHLPIQQAEATQLLHELVCSPQDFFTHIQRYTGSVILSVLYGKRAPQSGASALLELFNLFREWIPLLQPGAMPPVDILPILDWIPAKWQRDCSRVRTLQRALYIGLLDETQARVQRGQENGSYMEEVLARQHELGMDREMMIYLGGALVEGGSETTAAYLHSLILALVAYPDAQRKAHDEIDRVVGEDRMPTLDDIEQMPFIRAMILETHRFRPVTPLLIPHATSKQEEYRGYIIPKGATIMVNLWGIFHDPELYDKPEEFIPERYLLTEYGTKPGVDGSSIKHNLPFGVGRRSCPGIHLAQNSIKLNVMNLLWAFNFNAGIDSEGNTIKPDIFAYHQGLAVGPRPFQCRIRPRTGEKAAIIKHEFLEAADIFAKFEVGSSAKDEAS